MSEPYTVNIILNHQTISASAVLEEISNYFDEGALSKETEWGLIECTELLKVPEEFASFVTVWKFQFATKQDFQKYKLIYPENYRELREHMERYEKRYHYISAHPDTQSIELNTDNPPNEQCRFLDESWRHYK